MTKAGIQKQGDSKGLGELWTRLRFLFIALVIYRIGTHIPVPGIDPDRLFELFGQNQGTIVGMFNMFFWWCAGAYEYFGLRNHAIYICLHYHAANVSSDSFARAA